MPEVGGSKVVSILIVVLLPAPFGPKSPKISPPPTLSVIALTAVRSPKTAGKAVGFKVDILDHCAADPKRGDHSMVGYASA